ncbi:complex I NDUFA9 subunit family protein [Halomonas sp. WWR20]
MVVCPCQYRVRGAITALGTLSTARTSFMAKRIVTVFGGTGFLGRRVVRRLAEAGIDVRVAARHLRHVDVPDATGTVEFRRTDVRDEASVVQALQGADAAVNAVSLYVERRDLRFEDIHVAAAERIARLATQAGVSILVHISGLGVSTTSASSYVRARAQGERQVRAAFPEAVVLRPSVIFGPGDAFLSALEGITRLPVIPLFGDGRVELQPVHVGDVAAAVERVQGWPAAAGRVFELGGARAYRYRDIVQAVLKSRGRRRPLLPIPFAVWHRLAALASLLPNPPLTRDQVTLMENDNVVGTDTFAALGITPRSLEAALGTTGVSRHFSDSA